MYYDFLRALAFSSVSPHLQCYCTDARQRRVLAELSDPFQSLIHITSANMGFSFLKISADTTNKRAVTIQKYVEE